MELCGGGCEETRGQNPEGVLSSSDAQRPYDRSEGKPTHRAAFTQRGYPSDFRVVIERNFTPRSVDFLICASEAIADTFHEIQLQEHDLATISLQFWFETREGRALDFKIIRHLNAVKNVSSTVNLNDLYKPYDEHKTYMRCTKYRLTINYQ